MTGLNEDQKNPNDNKDNIQDHRNEHLTDDVLPNIPNENRTAPDHPQKDTNIDATEAYTAGMEEAAETHKPDHVDDEIDEEANPMV